MQANTMERGDHYPNESTQLLDILIQTKLLESALLSNRDCLF